MCVVSPTSPSLVLCPCVDVDVVECRLVVCCPCVDVDVVDCRLVVDGRFVDVEIDDRCVISGSRIRLVSGCVNEISWLPQSYMYLYRQPVGDFRVKVCE